MYEVVEGTGTDVFFVYLVVIGACLLLSPLYSFIFQVIGRGLEKWR